MSYRWCQFLSWQPLDEQLKMSFLSHLLRTARRISLPVLWEHDNISIEATAPDYPENNCLVRRAGVGSMYAATI